MGMIRETGAQEFQADMDINLTINGMQYNVFNADPNMFLNEFLRCHLHLKGEISPGNLVKSLQKSFNIP